MLHLSMVHLLTTTVRLRPLRLLAPLTGGGGGPLHPSVEGQARLELGWSCQGTLATRPWTFLCALPVAGCTCADGMIRQRTIGEDTLTGPALGAPHACGFVSWLLHCTPRKRPCFLLVAMMLRCYALPPYPRRSNGLALVAVANANALHMPLPPKLDLPVSPVLWVLRHAVGHLRQPWDPRDRARQEPPVGVRCPVTLIDGRISGYDYDYDYTGMYAIIAVFRLCQEESLMGLKDQKHSTALN